MTARQTPLLDDAAVLKHAITLARVGGAAAVTPEAVAQRCRVAVSDLPDPLQTSRQLQRRVTPLATAALARHIGQAVDGISRGDELLRHVGRAYIEFALDEPGWFEMSMFTEPSMVNAKSEQARHNGKTPYEYLEHAFTTLVAEGRVSPHEVTGASMTCWAGVHGFATLASRGPLRAAEPAKLEYLTHQIVDRLVRSAVDGAPAPELV